MVELFDELFEELLEELLEELFEELLDEELELSRIGGVCELSNSAFDELSISLVGGRVASSVEQANEGRKNPKDNNKDKTIFLFFI